MSIVNVMMRCLKCGWIGAVLDCEPDVDGDGSLGCPKCLAICQELCDQSFRYN